MARGLRITLGVLLALATGFGALLLWAHWHLHVAPFRGDSFTPARWQQVWACDGQSNPDCAMRRADCARGAMIGDLLGRHLHAGMTLAQSRALLGEPDDRADRIEGDVLLSDCDSYGLGMCSGFGVDWTSLQVCAAADGRIIALGLQEN